MKNRELIMELLKLPWDAEVVVGSQGETGPVRVIGEGFYYPYRYAAQRTRGGFWGDSVPGNFKPDETCVRAIMLMAVPDEQR